MQYFRRARPASTRWNLAKTAAQIVLFWGVFLFLLPPWVVVASSRLGVPTFPSDSFRVLAVVLFAGASALGLVSGFTMAVHGQGTPLPFDGPRRLVVSGPYTLVRNPMAIAGLVQGMAVALWHGSVAVSAYVIAGGILWHFVVRPREEEDLARTFGAAFVEYKSRVPLWLPRRPGFRPGAID
jgi:protein-S-isoprenylcysteine O-methyltransferase Ste14